MVDGRALEIGQVLRALADLASSAEQRTEGLTVPTEWFRWLPVGAVELFGLLVPEVEVSRGGAPRAIVVDRRFGERLAAVDLLRPEERSLRVGWLFVAGRLPEGHDGPDGAGRPGQRRRVLHPLVTMPVRVERPAGLGRPRLHPAGDVELTDLVRDPGQRIALGAAIETGGGALHGMTEIAIPPALLRRFPRLRTFARAVAEAAGLPARELVPAGDSPERLVRADGLVIVVGAAVYAVHSTGGTSRAGSLRAWSTQPLDRPTALHALFLDPEGGQPSADAPEVAVRSPYLLTPVQRAAVERSRVAPVTLISGAPGTGKSHTVAAIACDALARGETVLVTAKTDASVDALVDLLERAPGPDPVVFGSNERREALATRLAGGTLQPVPDSAVRAARDRLAEATARRDALWRSIADRLDAERLLATDGAPGPSVPAPGAAIDPQVVDLDELARLLHRATDAATGWWSRRRRRRAARSLAARIGVARDTPTDALARAVRELRTLRAAAELVAAGGLEIGDSWDALRRLDDEVHRATARWLAAESRSERRLDRSTLQAVAVLATALRSGRAARRAQLERLDHRLTRALPLWVGTLPDIDDLLPPVAGLFDLVILDEGSSIDQPLAAPALLRGRRAVVAGDPRQLRHVSFVSDAQMADVVAAHGLDAAPVLAARLDVRRNSVFDVAAGVAPVVTLDEHFRSDPHLVDFVSRRLYGGTVRVATRSPRSESRRCLSVVRVAGGVRDGDGVVQAEVDHALRLLRELRAQGTSRVGVVTPFRAQADALERAVLASFDTDDIEALDLRVGTVHGFQGNERDVVIASLGVGEGGPAGAWRFVEDPHLFTVLVTRARQHLTVLVSGQPPAGGLIDLYLSQAESPPGRPRSAGEVSAWAKLLADDLSRAGVAVTTAYPTGRHVLDVVFGDPTRSVAVECDVHPDGSQAHIERHLALRRAGWDVVEAHRSRWEDRPGELVVDLARTVTPRRRPEGHMT